MDMYTVDELRAIIKEELDKKEYIQEPYSLFEPILYILEDGGKRLRPLLTLMAYNLYREYREGTEIRYRDRDIPQLHVAA